jgi:hypothetical protein
MIQGFWRGPVIKEGLRFWIRRDVLSHGPARGANAVTQRVQLARIAAMPNMDICSMNAGPCQTEKQFLRQCQPLHRIQRLQLGKRSNNASKLVLEFFRVC